MNSKKVWAIALMLASVVATCSAQKLSKITLAVPVVAGGVGTTGTVELTGKAPATGIVVTLTSSQPTVTVPASITIPSGATSATFPVGSIAVATSLNAIIKATLNKASESVALKVAAPEVAEFTFIPTSVQGGSGSTATVKITSAAPAGGIPVHFSSTTSSWGGPPTVTVPAGATAASFSFTTIAVGSKLDATVTATIGGSHIPSILTLTPPILTGFTLSSPTVAGGLTVIGTLKLTGAAPKEGVRVSLTSEVNSVKVPETVTIPQGQTMATFTVSTKPTSDKVAVRILATAPASSIELALTVNPPTIDSVVLSSTSLAMGGTGSATVTLSAAAPATGLSLTLSSSSSSIKLPTMVTVPPGATSVTFNFSVGAVASIETPTITVTSPSGVSKGATLTVSPTTPSKRLPPGGKGS